MSMSLGQLPKLGVYEAILFRKKMLLQNDLFPSCWTSLVNMQVDTYLLTYENKRAQMMLCDQAVFLDCY